MSSATQFSGGGSTRAIINMHSSGGTSSAGIQANAAYNGAKEVLSGALSANTLVRLINLTGSGRLPLLSLYAKDATPRQVRLQVIVDGRATPAFDAQSNTVSAAGSGNFAAGQFDAGFVEGEPINYSSSCEVWVASNRAESGTGNDQLGLAYKHI